MNTILTAQPGMVNQRTLKWKTPLMLAVTMDHLACVESLLGNGADPDIANVERETPLYKGIQSIYPSMAFDPSKFNFFSSPKHLVKS